ncbi:MAG: NAD-dependent epimerase/dehydratase family protein [Bacteroidetes bacterium]|jgi:nucleoside-diphosphate-sugar epimerase|nr:NAD-dependent epimerase/dehydratase family protein [Bacteroidota bacterium]
MSKILVTGACGQLGSELTAALRDQLGNESVIATDVADPNPMLGDGPFERLDVLDKENLNKIVMDRQVDTIYHLAAILSARAEQNISLAWKLNMDGLLNVLNCSKEHSVERVFWPSSIAVFGPDAHTDQTPQESACNPTTVYGISKLAGEQWCAYYHRKFDVDVRSLRYPGLIGYKTMPGGGTTDYAVDIYHKAVRGETFHCFLEPGSKLPMMYMEDAVKATIDLMDVPADSLTIRTSYNVSAMSFSPEEIAASIQKFIPSFEIEYEPDYRQAIAESWPDSIDDSAARNDWKWKPSHNLDSMSKDIIENLPEFWDLELPDTVK